MPKYHTLKMCMEHTLKMCMERRKPASTVPLDLQILSLPGGENKIAVLAFLRVVWYFS